MGFLKSGLSGLSLSLLYEEREVVRMLIFFSLCKNGQR